MEKLDSDHPDVRKELYFDDEIKLADSWTVETEQHTVPMFQMYFSNEYGEYSWYMKIQSSDGGNVNLYGMTKEEASTVTSSLKVNPFIAQHRSPDRNPLSDG